MHSCIEIFLLDADVLFSNPSFKTKPFYHSRNCSTISMQKLHRILLCLSYVKKNGFSSCTFFSSSARMSSWVTSNIWAHGHSFIRGFLSSLFCFLTYPQIYSNCQDLWAHKWVLRTGSIFGCFLGARRQMLICVSWLLHPNKVNYNLMTPVHRHADDLMHALAFQYHCGM